MDAARGGPAARAGGADPGWYNNEVELSEFALQAALERALIREELCVTSKVAAARIERAAPGAAAVGFTVAEVVEAFSAAVARAGGC